MALNKSSSGAAYHRSGHQGSPEFWQQLGQEFSFAGVDEDQLRLRTEQWLTCASEILGTPPQTRKKAKRYIA
ncbi:MAG: hypothetical protein AAGI45_24415 [Cyanobacteria bacterium P01_H01_bin.26]